MLIRNHTDLNRIKSNIINFKKHHPAVGLLVLLWGFIFLGGADRMASSAVQIAGFLLALVGVSATIAATFKVEWRMEVHGKHRTYDGLWMSCGGTMERTTCEWHTTVIKLPSKGARAPLFLHLFTGLFA